MERDEEGEAAQRRLRVCENERANGTGRATDFVAHSSVCKEAKPLLSLV